MTLSFGSLVTSTLSLQIELLDEQSFDNDRFDYVFFSAGGSQSKKFAPIAADRGAVVIDNSSGELKNNIFIDFSFFSFLFICR